MNLPLLLSFLTLLLSSSCGAAQPTPSEDLQQKLSFALQPSLLIVIAVFLTVFSLTSFLLVCTKFCHRTEAELYGIDGENERQRVFDDLPPPRFSGLDKTTIESLPFFQFSFLKGPREGLECSICLSGFEDAEILRLLPKCKHAFHKSCVDKWLQIHSCCPLCRCKVEAEDATLFKYSTSSRSLFHDRAVPEELLEEEDTTRLYVERVTGGSDDPSAFTCKRSSDRKSNEEFLLPKGYDGFHKRMHRIILSDIIFKKRWSDMQSFDFVSLTSEMLAVAPHGPFSKGSTDEESRCIIPSAFGSSSEVEGNHGVSPFCGRSMSDINFARLSIGISQDENVYTSHCSRDENLLRRWMPIARRTIQLLGGKEMRPIAEQKTR
ncbi:putative RING-H2 finger protein ATL12 [Wolffia australiana]